MWPRNRIQKERNTRIEITCKFHLFNPIETLYLNGLLWGRGAWVQTGNASISATAGAAAAAAGAKEREDTGALQLGPQVVNVGLGGSRSLQGPGEKLIGR